MKGLNAPAMDWIISRFVFPSENSLWKFLKNGHQDKLTKNVPKKRGWLRAEKLSRTKIWNCIHLKDPCDLSRLMPLFLISSTKALQAIWDMKKIRKFGIYQEQMGFHLRDQILVEISHQILVKSFGRINALLILREYGVLYPTKARAVHR